MTSISVKVDGTTYEDDAEPRLLPAPPSAAAPPTAGPARSNWTAPPSRAAASSHGTHLCAVEVDTETGAVHIRSYVCVDDVGEVVNPLIVEGQLPGGIAQGIAQGVPGAPDLPDFVTDRTKTRRWGQRAWRAARWRTR